MKDLDIHDLKGVILERLIAYTQQHKMKWRSQMARPAVLYYFSTVEGMKSGRPDSTKCILGWRPGDHAELFLVTKAGTLIISGLGDLQNLWNAIALSNPTPTLNKDREVHLALMIQRLLPLGD